MPREYGWTVMVNFRRGGQRCNGWMRWDPAEGKCQCGAHSGPLESGQAVKVWLVEHDHEEQG